MNMFTVVMVIAACEVFSFNGKFEPGNIPEDSYWSDLIQQIESRLFS